MRIAVLMISVLALCAPIGDFAQAQVANPSAYRQVDAGGLGNCIFSSAELPFRNEDAPGYSAIKADFVEGENVHVRCYWPKQGGDYAAVGKIWNSIRDDQRFHSSLIWVRPAELKADSPDFFINSVKTTVDAQFAAADQQRFDIVDAPDCDFQISMIPKQTEYGVTSPNNCIGLAEFARAMARKHALEDPGSFRFCVQQYVEAADAQTQVREWDRTLGKHRYSTRRNEYRHLMARGCFNFRLEH